MRAGYSVFYEWVVEELRDDGSGDIEECFYWDEAQLAEALACRDEILRRGKPADFGLCRRGGDDVEGEQERGYAYRAADLSWPSAFDDGKAIPKRFYPLPVI